MKKFSLFLIIFTSLFLFTKTAEAKVLPQAQKSGTTASTNSAEAGIYVQPRLRADRKALIINFANLQNATNVSYTLTYTTNEQEEGAIGTLNLNGGSSQTSELLFGTCSKNVCRYHTGITNMHLKVPYTSKSGNKSIKRFRIKV